MSLSWTKALRARLPRDPDRSGAGFGARWGQKLSGTASHVLGIAIGAHHVSAAYAAVSGQVRRVEWAKRKELTVPFFCNGRTDEHAKVLGAALAELCAPVAHSYIPIYVALPDPLVNFTVFELDQLPAGARAQAELVRWRFAKEAYGNGRAFACTNQYLGQAQDKHLLLGLAIDQSWLDVVQQASVHAGVVFWGTNMAACYQHNRFHSVFTQTKQGGALIVLDESAWTLSLWDAEGRLRFVRSRWRNGVGADFYDTVASESERVVLAYARGESERAVARLYLVADVAEANALTAVLNQRLKDEVVVLPVTHGLEAKSSLDVTVAAALAQ